MGNDAAKGTFGPFRRSMRGRCPAAGQFSDGKHQPGNKGAATGCAPSTPVQLVEGAWTMECGCPRSPKKMACTATSCALRSVGDLCRCGYV